MLLLRLILLGLLLYLVLRLVKSLLKGEQKRVEVHGRPKGKKPLNLSDSDIEDADFEEINGK